MVINPAAAFIRWYDGLSPAHRQHLAHVYYVCTTQDTTDMLMAPADSLQRFVRHLARPDFPLRLVARMFIVRTVFDLLLVHRKELIIAPDEWIPSGSRDKMISLGRHRWDRVMDSWAALRAKELSDSHLHAWAASIIKNKNKRDVESKR
jgi:hypothetical protein